MNLTLEVTGPQGDELGSARRKTFRRTGGTIGRVPGNDWVLPDGYVSSNHAVIRYTNDTYYIEDISRNGTSLNSSDNRLEPQQPYSLNAGDRIFIPPYEILVLFENESSVARGAKDFFPGAHDSGPNPFLVDSGPVAIDSEDWFPSTPSPRPPDVPRAEQLPGHSPIHDEYQPPRVIPADPPSSGVDSHGRIPTHYNFLSPDESVIAPPLTPPVPPSDVRPPVRPKGPRPGPSNPIGGRPSSVRNEPPAPPAKAPAVRSGGAGSLADVLEGAGVHGVEVTPELARDFGRIFHVVVSGVMAVLKSRQDIKDEFRLGATTMQPKANNPLKFSANVEDALHRLLVQRNQAYLAPVEAFEDAFGDVRNHQMAMLAGMKAAFEAMLAEFDPGRLEEEFDRQSKGALLKMPAKMRYWDLYSEKIRGMVSDADASFQALFGEEFAAAYEAQLKRLKARGGSDQS